MRHPEVSGHRGAVTTAQLLPPTRSAVEQHGGLRQEAIGNSTLHNGQGWSLWIEQTVGSADMGSSETTSHGSDSKITEIAVW